MIGKNVRTTDTEYKAVNPKRVTNVNNVRRKTYSNYIYKIVFNIILRRFLCNVSGSRHENVLSMYRLAVILSIETKPSVE